MDFAEIIIPVPLNVTFTYAVPPALKGKINVGHRVIVPFGKKKFYTGIVCSLLLSAPEGVEIKEIVQLLDNDPVVIHPQLKLWNWIADYYLASLGDVMKAALPAGLKVESETFLELNSDFDIESHPRLSERQAIVLQLLEHSGKRMSVAEIEKETGLKNVNALASQLLESGAVIISEKLIERYRSQTVTHVRINGDRNDSGLLHAHFTAVKGAKKQEIALMALLEMSGFTRRGSELNEVPLAELLGRAAVTRPIVNAMAKKGVVEIYKKEVNRFKFSGSVLAQLPDLSEAQANALAEIHRQWLTHPVTLLRGITSSGKTEIYIHLIDFLLKQGRQTLFLVPEIALTTQLTRRLQKVFGSKVIIYHSKFSDNERVDIWKKLLTTHEPCVVLGARSAVFLPFTNLGLVIVDEEHEGSFKQENPAPRYNARDTAMVLAAMHGAKTLLGSATPSVETYHKAVIGKYGLVELTERYGGAVLPKIEIINTLRARRQGQMKGMMALRTEQIINTSLENGKQSILFLNRRGYAPVAECKMCAYTPKCENCDVTLTYHKNIDRMVCHYCGAMYPVPRTCPSCKEPAVEIFGYGTERIADEVEKYFPEAAVARMDLDTTRNKDGYENIIAEFSSGKKQLLVGTQMVTKGLDFDGVDSVAVLNADTMLNMPDFRASERAFNMLEQVSGRAGRRNSEGTVAIQTRQPEHPLFNWLLEHDYKGFYTHEIKERQKFNYPPFTRVIYIYLRHRDRRTLQEIAVAYGRRLRQLFGNRVYGPEEPVVSRVQLLYIQKFMLKVEVNASMSKVKQILRETYTEMLASPLSAVKGTIVSYDVDPY